MARLVTSGLELGTLLTGESTSAPDGSASGQGIVVDTVTPRLGLGAAQKFTAQSGALTANRQFTFSPSGTTLFLRLYFRMDSVANINDLVTIANIGGSALVVRYEATVNDIFSVLVNNLTVPQDTYHTELGVWKKLEMKLKIGVGATDEYAVYIDNFLLAAGTGANAGTDSLPTGFILGQSAPLSTISSALQFSIDDIAINDDSGSFQNSYPGHGKIVLATPLADSAIGTGWTDDALAVTNLFQAVDNEPPLGVTDTTSGFGAHQIRNATSNANVNYDATLPSYTALGITLEDKITVLVPIISTAAPVATSAKAGTYGVVSNPPITNIALGAGGTAGAFWSGTAAGSYPVGWKWSYGTTTYNPYYLPGTAPVLRITQVTASTRIAMVDFMGMYVEFVTPKTTTLPPATPILVKLVRGMGGKLRRLHDNILIPDYQFVPPSFNYTDSDTIATVTSVQSSDSTDLVDTSGAVNGTSSVISSEIAQTVDADTPGSATSVTATETADYAETATVASTTSIASSEVFTPYIDRGFVTPLLITLGQKVKFFRLLHDSILGETPPPPPAQYTDAATISSVTSVQSSESTDFLDTAGAITGTSSIASTELASYVDSSTVGGVSSVSATDVAADVESATISSVTTPSATEVAAYVDSNTASGITSLTATETVAGTDATTVSSGTTPSSSDTAQYVDADVPASITSVISTELFVPYIDRGFVTPLLITLGQRVRLFRLLHDNILGESPQVPSTQYTDAATISSITSVSATETAAYVDTGTTASTTVPSTTDVLGAIESNTVASSTSITTTEVESGVDSSTGATTTTVTSAETAQYVESATIASNTSVSSVDLADTLDSATVSSQSSVISSDVSAITDSTTGATVTTIISLETAQYVDSSTISGVSAVTTTDVADYVDATTISGVTSVSSAELHEIPDTGTVSGTSTVITADTAQYVDSDTPAGVTSISSTDVAAYIDADIPTGITSVSSTDFFAPGGVRPATQVLLIRLARYHRQLRLLGSNTLASPQPAAAIYQDSATISSVSSVTSTDVAAYVDATTVSTTTTPSATDAIADLDSNTVSGKTTPSTNEIAAYVESATIGSVSTPSATDVAAYVDFNTISGATNISSTDVKNSSTTDSSTIPSITNPTAVESYQAVDAASINSTTTPTTVDNVNYVDGFTPSTLTSPFSTDTAQYVESGTVAALTQITYSEIYTQASGYLDSATVASKTYIISDEGLFIGKTFAFTGYLRQRWTAESLIGHYAIVAVSSRWQAVDAIGRLTGFARRRWTATWRG